MKNTMMESKTTIPEDVLKEILKRWLNATGLKVDEILALTYREGSMNVTHCANLNGFAQNGTEPRKVVQDG